MGITIKASELYYKYPKDIVNRASPKFSGKPDRGSFNRNDLYEVLPMLAAVMDELGQNEQRVLHLLEEILIHQLPRFIDSREAVFDFLVGSLHEQLEMT